MVDLANQVVLLLTLDVLTVDLAICLLPQSDLTISVEDLVLTSEKLKTTAVPVQSD